MKTQSSARPFGFIRLSVALLAAMVFGVLGTTSASALTINVVGVGPDGKPLAAPITGYRWTVEEDATKASVPGQPATIANLAFSFHTSYMPVVAAGRVGDAKGLPPTQDPDVLRLYEQSPATLNLDPGKRYFVSVAAEGFQMGGAPVVFSGGVATATVYLNQYPVPTAQVSVFVFHDNNPINGAPDQPAETGLAGFTVQLLEAGGTYGQSGGQVTQDGFGNPLGTTYRSNPDGSPMVDAGAPVVLKRGSGIILSGADGLVTIKNLYPGKYTILVAPPVGAGWVQTSTIEGTKGVDAWIKNNEPVFATEFGPPGPHVFIGFTKSGVLTSPSLMTGTSTITGRVVGTHTSRLPAVGLFPGAPISECWVGLQLPGGQALYASKCDKDSKFTIPNVPTGSYELVVWDEPLDIIIGATTINVAAGLNDLGDVTAFQWFARYQGRVFQDIDGTGLPFFAAPFDRPYVYVHPVTGVEEERQQSFATGDIKPPFGAGVANNIRFRDGSIYQATTTKDDGTFAFTEMFPFFNWMVAEIDYARFKATSATVVVDDGGAIDPGANKSKLWNAALGQFGSSDPALKSDPWIRLNPQCQENCEPNSTTKKYFRTESVDGGSGAILLEAMQNYAGQTNHIEWGKTPYKITENGGIAGIVYYAITRAEDDPRFAAAENWEPGIPRVQVNVYLDCDADGKPDKPKNDGTGQCDAGGLSGANHYTYDPPDVDNYPFCWRGAGDAELCPAGAPTGMGLEDDCRSAACKAAPTGSKPFSYGDVFKWGAPATEALPNPGPNDQIAVGLGKTDSWDDSIPTGCPDQSPYVIPNTTTKLDCFDGLRNFNQVRPAVFDGGFAFGRVANQAELPMIIGANGDGKYILEAVAPPGYLHQGNGDKNVVFGDVLQASPAALPHECVGMELDVPESLTLFPGEDNPNFGSPQYPNNKWRKCDMKSVPLTPGLNAAPNFFMYTEAPVAAHGVGFILDDTTAEFSAVSPNFGEKYSPPHLPVSVQDWTGREITRVYSDQFGHYNFLVPSSFTVNPPFPSGVMPNMLVACMNHPGPIADPNDPTKQILDPYFHRGYSQFCYTFQYLAGKTTYLDTPVVPVAAFAAIDTNPLDCECEDKTPAIYSANNGTDNGPWVPASGNRQLTIVSVGKMDVVNPVYDPAVDPVANPTDPRTRKFVKRDYGFGPDSGARSVTLGTVPLTIVSWSDGFITATVPDNAITGQLMVTRGDNQKQSVVGLTVHVGGTAPTRVNAGGIDAANCGVGAALPCKTIQYAVDKTATANGGLITIAPGTYNEAVILDKRVRLQGWGAGSTYINAAMTGTGGLAAWRALLDKKIDKRIVGGVAVPGPNRTFDLLPGQALDGINAVTPLLFGAEEAPGVLVVGKLQTLGNGDTTCVNRGSPQQIDGLTITGSSAGGGVLASGYACNLVVANNRVVSNYGTYGGGVRIGHTMLADGNTYTDAVNRNVYIHHNWISQNGATSMGGGGGITLGTGSDSYIVARNYVCGNFTMADGGGISHLGRSAGSFGPPQSGSVQTANQITHNQIIFNQNFAQGSNPTGGGLYIGGQVALGGNAATGTGDVLIESNLLQGNQAGASAGGGASVALTVPIDDIHFVNNTIVNNVAAYAGGGIAVTNTGAAVKMVNNTLASNVSTGTGQQAFPSGPLAPSAPQVAGIALVRGTPPVMLNNIVWGNRSYIYLINGTNGLFNPGTVYPATPGDPIVNAPLDPNTAYLDLSTGLQPRYSVLTATTANTTNYGGGVACTNTGPTSGTTLRCNRLVAATAGATLFVGANDFTASLQSAATLDEGGNFINVRFQPLTLWRPDASLYANYHIAGGSIAQNNGRNRSGNQNNNSIPIGANLVPTTDIDDQNRVNAVDIGSDEIP